MVKWWFKWLANCSVNCQQGSHLIRRSLRSTVKITRDQTGGTKHLQQQEALVPSCSSVWIEVSLLSLSLWHFASFETNTVIEHKKFLFQDPSLNYWEKQLSVIKTMFLKNQNSYVCLKKYRKEIKQIIK